MSPDAVFPPALGERIGTIKVTVPGVTARVEPARSSRRCPHRRQPVDDPWWARAAGAVGDAIGDAIDGLVGPQPPGSA